MLADVVKAEALDPHTVRYSFKGTLTRDLPLTVAGLPIFSKAYYASHDFAQTTLDPPLGSGPYTVGEVKQGRTHLLQARPELLGQGSAGQSRPLELRRDPLRIFPRPHRRHGGVQGRRLRFPRGVHLEGRGRPNTTSRRSRDGRVKKEILPDETPSGTQGFFLNTRREQLKDPRVRKALDLAFDFEWTNSNLFYSLYTRTQSFFENSTMKAEGEPSPAEKGLLEGLGAPVSPEALGPAYLPPKTDGSGNNRSQLERPESFSTRQAGPSRTASASMPKASHSSSRS